MLVRAQFPVAVDECVQMRELREQAIRQQLQEQEEAKKKQQEAAERKKQVRQ